MPQHQRTLLTNATLLDVHRGHPFPQGTSLLLDGGRLHLFPPGKTPTKTYTTQDLHGGFVGPALINSHAHVQLTFPGLTVTLKDLLFARPTLKGQVERTLRTAWIRGIHVIRDAATEDLRPNRRINRRIAAGTLFAPEIRQAVVISLEGSRWTPKRGFKTRLQHLVVGLPHLSFSDHNAGAISFPPEINDTALKRIVDEAIDVRHANAIKIYDQRAALLTCKDVHPLMSQHHLEVITRHAQQRGVPVVMHQFTAESFLRGVQAGVDVISHLPLDRELTNDEVARFVDRGILLEPTLSLTLSMSFPKALEHYEQETMEELQRHHAVLDKRLSHFFTPPMARVTRRSLTRAQKGRFSLGGIIPMGETFRFHAPLLTTGLQNLKRLYQAGALLSCGNDGGIPPLTPAMLGVELRLLRAFLSSTRRGFTGADALRCATTHAASALGDPQRGAIQEHGVADLLLFSTNPLESPEIIGEPVAGAWRGGVFWEPVEASKEA